MKQSKPFQMHKIMGLDRKVTLAHTGTMKVEDVLRMREMTGNYLNMGWPAEIEKKDFELGRLYDFDPISCVTAEGSHPDDREWIDDFVTFGKILDPEGMRRIIFRYLPQISGLKHDIQSFRCWFAHLHRDEMEICRAQVNIALRNDAGHKILSIDGKGRHHVFTPAAGDIFLLDTRARHAVIPNVSQGYAHMRENPMEVVFATLYDVQEGE